MFENTKRVIRSCKWKEKKYIGKKKKKVKKKSDKHWVLLDDICPLDGVAVNL